MLLGEIKFPQSLGESLGEIKFQHMILRAQSHSMYNNAMLVSQSEDWDLLFCLGKGHGQDFWLSIVFARCLISVF